MIAHAQTVEENITSGALTVVQKVNTVIIFPLITLLLGVALLVFLWGVAEYVRGSASDEVRRTGRQHMLWGAIGMFVMVSALAILRLATATVGADVPNVL